MSETDRKTPSAEERILRTPEMWCNLLGRTIVDPDGWRGREGRPWEDPICYEEFERRYVRCSVKLHRHGLDTKAWLAESERLAEQRGREQAAQRVEWYEEKEREKGNRRAQELMRQAAAAIRALPSEPPETNDA